MRLYSNPAFINPFIGRLAGKAHNITIRNDGRSDAHDFNVTFYIDGKQMIGIPHLDLPAGENMTIHLYNWTPMLLLHSYNLTVAADVLSGEDWTEVETDNNANEGCGVVCADAFRGAWIHQMEQRSYGRVGVSLGSRI